MKQGTTRGFALGTALAMAAAGLAMLAPASAASASVRAPGSVRAPASVHAPATGLVLRPNAGGETIVDVGAGTTDQKCLDQTGGVKQINIVTQLWSCNGRTQQEWTLTPLAGGYTIQNVKTGLCLAPYMNGAAASTPLIQYYCDGSYWEIWFWNGTQGIITNFNLGTALSPNNCSVANGTQIYLGDLCGRDLSTWS
jgi:Ricin-type beta-trefoil lectin domain-like